MPAFDFVQGLEVVDDAKWLSRTLQAAADGEFPAPDHGVRLVPGPTGAKAAVIAFTATHVIASDIPPDDIAERLRSGDVQLPTDPRFLAWLAERAGGTSSEDTIDVVLARSGADGLRDRLAPPSPELLSDERVAFAAETRRELRVLRTDDGVVVLGRGLTGRLEVSIELDVGSRGTGAIADMLAAALAEAGPEATVWGQIAAGNSVALKAATALGFVPVCSEYLIR